MTPCRYRIDGVRYVWVGAYNGDYSLFGDNSGGWNVADPDACAAEGIHHPRITEALGMYCSRCGKSKVTFRDAFTSDEDYAAHVAAARERAAKLMADLGWDDEPPTSATGDVSSPPSSVSSSFLAAS